MSEMSPFEYICADSSGVRNHLFSIDENYDYDDNDCHDTCIIWDHITFYGIPFELEDEQLDRIREGNYSDAVKIGEILGCLILCKQMIDEGEYPWLICDDVDGDLEYTISALRDDGGPLNVESGDPYQNVYYIHQFNMEEKYNQKPLKARVLEELPAIILRLFYVRPEILAFYPEPLEYELPTEQETRNDVLKQIAKEKLESSFSSFSEEKPEEIESNIVKFSDAYQFSEDEMNYIMRRRYSGSSYPEEAKDQTKYEFYLANNFEEAGESRMLFWIVCSD